MSKIRPSIQRGLWTIVLLAITGLGFPRLGSAEILLSVDVGNSWDWLTGANSLRAHPGQLQWWNTIRLLNSPFAQDALDGNVEVRVECCKDMLSKAPVSPAGLSMYVLPSGGCSWVASGQLFRIVCLPSLGPANVRVTPTVEGQANLIISTAANAAPGDYIATLHAQSALGHSTSEIFLSVLPARWPGDGVIPACAPPGLRPIPIGQLDPIAWKAKRPGGTSFTVGVGFGGWFLGPAGMEFAVSSPGSAPAPRTFALVTFKNTIAKGWPVAIRTFDSRTCTSGPLLVVPAGSTVPLPIDASNTTTLILSKSSCRAFVNIGNCWGGTALGLDDILIFGEGSFWALFGGRRVDIQTVGDWGAILTPDSIATIQTD